MRSLRLRTRRILTMSEVGVDLGGTHTGPAMMFFQTRLPTSETLYL